MTALVEAAPAEPVLRIALRVRDPSRRVVLEAMLQAAGHRLVEGPCDAILLDGDGEIDLTDVGHAVALGGQNFDVAASLAPNASAAQIDAALRAVAAGLLVRSRDAASGPFDAAIEPSYDSLLTPRETEILQAIADGLGNKAIARRLSISQHTVKYHVESVFRKMGVRSRAEAVSKAWRGMHGAMDL